MRTHKSTLSLFIIHAILMFKVGIAYALDEHSYAVGRYWSETVIEKPAPKLKQTETRLVISKPPAREVLSKLTEMIDEAKARAVLEPTYENVKQFIILKNKTTNIASRFSQVWQEVLLQNAHLDYSASHPANNQGIKVLNQQKQEKVERFLKASSQNTGLVYFYQGNDPMAHLQATIIMRLSKKYHFDVLGVSVDGIFINDFEKNTIDNGQAKKMGVQKIPALFSLTPSGGKYSPISYTLLAERDLELRLFDVLSHFEAWK